MLTFVRNFTLRNVTVCLVLAHENHSKPTDLHLCQNDVHLLIITFGLKHTVVIMLIY